MITDHSLIDMVRHGVQNYELHSQISSPKTRCNRPAGFISGGREKRDSGSARKGSATIGHRSAIHQETTMRGKLHDGCKAMATAGAGPLRGSPSRSP